MKRYSNIILLFVAMFFINVHLKAQTIQTSTQQDSATIKPVIKPKPIKIKKPKPISTELSVGGRLNTDGWSLLIDKGWVKTDDAKRSDKFYNTQLTQIEFSEHKHPKELKGTSTQLITNTNDKPKPYIYGKINNFYALKLGYGKRKMIAGKPDPGAISIHWVYLGGLSIGLLKPYYIDAYVPQDNPGTLARESIKYEGDYKDAFLAQQYIVGSSGWVKGIGETKFVPGLHAKTGLHFDFATSPKTKLALEVGLSGELYTQKIEMMANTKAFPYLLNAYIGLQFGKRW